MNAAATLDDVAASLRASGLRVERDVPSATYTTYRCGGPFAVLVRLGSLADARALARALAPPAAPVQVLVVGRGSNLLVSDTGFSGLAIVLDGDFEALTVDPTTAVATAGAAVPLPVLARRAAAAGVGGLEFFVGIPGSVGGAVRMNAGGHGRETRDVLVAAHVLDLGRGDVAERDAAGFAFGFRQSNVGRAHVVLDARFLGRPDDPDACNARIAEIVQWRREHQPGGQNAGSVFKNPPGDAAGRLIDTSGCKGLRVGGAVVSEKHANFFVADEHATAADIHALMGLVRRRVVDATGVLLEPELQLIGFDASLGDSLDDPCAGAPDDHEAGGS